MQDKKRPLYLKLPIRPAPFPPHAQRVLSRPIWLRHKKLTMLRGKDGERALMRSACALGGHEWIDAVPTRPEFCLPAVLFLPAFRHYLGLDTWMGEDLPLQCRHTVPAGTPLSAHALSCTKGGSAHAKHDALARAWLSFLRRCGVVITVDGEYAPFGAGDDRRLDGAVAGLPDTVWEMMLDVAITGVTNASGIARGKDTNLGAAVSAENDKRRKYENDLTCAGLGFIPVAHELTGAMGPAARDELFMPALKVMKEKELGQQARARA